MDIGEIEKKSGYTKQAVGDMIENISIVWQYGDTKTERKGMGRVIEPGI